MPYTSPKSSYTLGAWLPVGNCFAASLKRFLSSSHIWGSTSESKCDCTSTEISEMPGLEIEVNRFNCGICCNAISKGSVISRSTFSALAPGNCVTTCTCLIVKAGSSKRPILPRATAPPTKNTITSNQMLTGFFMA